LIHKFDNRLVSRAYINPFHTPQRALASHGTMIPPLLLLLLLSLNQTIPPPPPSLGLTTTKPLSSPCFLSSARESLSAYCRTFTRSDCSRRVRGVFARYVCALERRNNGCVLVECESCWVFFGGDGKGDAGGGEGVNGGFVMVVGLPWYLSQEG